MRYVLAILFWVGVFGTVREWRYARKHGMAITRAEKLYLAFVLPLIFGAQLVMDLAGLPFDVTLSVSLLAMGIALNAWAIKRRIQRTR